MARTSLAVLALLISMASLSVAETSKTCTPYAKCIASTFEPITSKYGLKIISNETQGCPGSDNYGQLPPDTCKIHVNATLSHFTFGMYFPANWTGSRILTVGNGAFIGAIDWEGMIVGPNYNMVAIGTDTGHTSEIGNMTWAINNTDAYENWAWKALNGSIAYGKLLAEQYYQAKPARSYYSGCSTGGRQGLKQIQIDESSFDGALIGSPAWRTDYLMPWVAKLGWYNRPSKDNRANIYQREWATLHNLAMAKCAGMDKLPGEDDKIIISEACRLDSIEDYRSVSCNTTDVGGMPPDPCLTDDQIATAMKVYSNYTVDGELVYPGPLPGSEDDFLSYLPQGNTMDFDQAWIRTVLETPSWQPSDENIDNAFRKAKATRPGNATADKFGISDFKKNGKIIMYAGLADATLPVGATNMYYEETGRALGRDDLTDWFRYFQIPGMRHCGFSATGMNAPWVMGGQGQASIALHDYTDYKARWGVPGHHFDPQFDALAALIDWVENKNAPEKIVATAYKDFTTVVDKTRPVCMYGQRARWNGSGDKNDWKSWDCKPL